MQKLLTACFCLHIYRIAYVKQRKWSKNILAGKKWKAEQPRTLRNENSWNVCKPPTKEEIKVGISGTYVSEALLIPTIPVRSPYVNKSDILRRAENIDRPVASEPLMKPSVLQIAFTYRQALTKCLKLQGPWCFFHKAWSQSVTWEIAGFKRLLQRRFNCAF